MVGSENDDLSDYRTYFIKKEWKIRAGQKKQLTGRLIITIDCCVIGSV